MKQEELKETIIAILHYLKNHMNTDAPVTIEDAIHYLQKNDTVLNHINYQNSSLNETLEAIKEEYKQLAVESIHSYQNSTKNIQQIAKKQHEQIQKLSSSEDDGTIDLNLIKEKFSSIQDHMIQEVERANAQIHQLKEKVKLLEEKNNLDPLTKAFNRRALQNYLQNITQKKNIKRELHLLMIDIDNFKQINDKYGHIAGDKILIFIAHMLKKTLRDGDKVFRYGGEEFVVILNRINTEHCIKISNRLLTLVSSNKLVYKNDTIQVTVSIGGTKFIPGKDTPESILDRADKALYEAKRNGKNRFIPYSEDIN